jgi:hypothetical protein
MEEKDFFTLCYDQYKNELSQADSIIQRGGLILNAQAIVGGAAIALGRAEAFSQFITRLDVFIYYTAAGLALASVLVSAAFLFYAVCPRGYPALAPMKEWESWRKGHCGNAIARPDKETLESLIRKTCESQAVNAASNERRRKAFGRAIIVVAVAMLLMSVEAVFRFILQVEGILK